MEQDPERACLRSFELHESESVSLPMRALLLGLVGCTTGCLAVAVRPPDRSIGSDRLRVGIRAPLLGILSVRLVRNCHFASIRVNCSRPSNLLLYLRRKALVFSYHPHLRS